MYVRSLMLYTFNLYNAVYQLYLNTLKKTKKQKTVCNWLEKTPALRETLDYINSS